MKPQPVTFSAALEPAQVSAPAAAIPFHGTLLLPDPAGLLYWPEMKTLIAADLHFEKGSSFARRRIFLPPYDTRATLAVLHAAFERWRPHTFVALGDSFHDRGARDRLSDRDTQAIRKLTGSCEFLWVTGNHDPHPPSDLGGHVCADLQIGPLSFSHEPDPQAEGRLSGHLHPCARLRRRGRTFRRPCFATDGRALVLPALGAYTGGLNVLDKAFANILETPFIAWLLGRSEVFPIRSAGLAPD